MAKGLASLSPWVHDDGLREKHAGATLTNSEAAAAGLAVDTSVCLHQAELPVEKIMVREDVFARGKLLNRAADGTLRSAIALLAEGEALALPPGGGTVQLFVLDGHVHADNRPIGANGFAALPGAGAHHIVATTATRAIIICDRPCAGDNYPQAAYIADYFAIEPFTPTIDGRLLEGFERRVLWLDARTGADTRLLKVPGGFAGAGPNWHPVNEEIFCISGDIRPDETRPMRAGSYLLNPARSIHGFDERTEGGCILLEWHDGPWDLVGAPGTERPAK